MGVHDGHRERLRESFAEHGLDSFNDVNALELLLFYAIPRKDTNELAHALLKQFGDLNGVFEASYQELVSVPGIGPSAAMLITLVPQMNRKILVSGTKKIAKVGSVGEAARYLGPRYTNERDEVLLMLCIDPNRNVIGCREVGRGVVNAIETNIRIIVETALKMKTSSVIISHNHPSGNLNPSAEDRSFTAELYRALQTVGIRLEDHLLFAGDGYVSFAKTGIMNSL